MFCYQCQETVGGIGCTKMGACGKTDELSTIQDLMIYVLKGYAYLNQIARKNKMNNPSTDRMLINNTFMTITNANFDKGAFIEMLEDLLKVKDSLLADLKARGLIEGELPDQVTWTGAVSDFDTKARRSEVGILSQTNEDVRSLRELIIYGLKGMAAYVEHADNLGFYKEEIITFMEKAYASTLDDRLSKEALIALVMETGKYGVEAMALLDEANTTSYGHPELTEVNIGTRNNPAILISGHDLKDMEELLEQTAGTGVDVYTHSEMLAANYYPAFKKYDHFVGNYGNAWWQQTKEFVSFNGPILFTTNCIVPPKAEIADKIYTTGASGFEGCVHIPDRIGGGKKDFSQLIEHAKKCPPPIQIEDGFLVGGFAHHQVMALADQVVEAVKAGDIKQFFVMAGCDGRMKDRTYYTEFAEKLPRDTVILTAGCAKYRYNKLDLGNIGGIPRVLDAGQCNDSYSLAVIAMKLKEVFGLEDINELPISYNIAWYEQKACIVLLALLYLGVKNIHLGPTLPAFLSPNVASILVETFGIGGINTVEGDIEMFLG